MIGTDNACLSPPPRQTTWPTGEWGYSIRRPSYAGPVRPVRPEAVLPDRALYLPTFSHFLIVNKTALSLSRSLSLSLSLFLSLSLSLSLSPETRSSKPDTNGD